MTGTHIDGADCALAGRSPYARNVIGRRLRGHYAQIVAEPLPDRFITLLDELQNSEHETERVNGGADQ
jgi:hypothetical protein